MGSMIEKETKLMRLNTIICYLDHVQMIFKPTKMDTISEDTKHNMVNQLEYILASCIEEYKYIEESKNE
jgi:hypothetical protein